MGPPPPPPPGLYGQLGNGAEDDAPTPINITIPGPDPIASVCNAAFLLILALLRAARGSLAMPLYEA